MKCKFHIFSAAHEKHVQIWAMWDQVRDATLEWVEEVKVDNRDNLEKKISEWEIKLEAVRNSRLAERAEKRKKERKELAMQAKIAEERKRREDEERARQAVIDSQRRPHDRDGRRREMENSAAMQDNDWRRNAPARDAPPPRDSRPMRGDGPTREPREQFIPSSKADTDSSWRSSAQPRKPDDRRSEEFRRDDGPRRGDDGPRRSDDFRRNENDGPRRGPPLPVSKADTVDKWERGAKPVTSPPQKTESPPAAAPEPKSDGPKKFVPPHLRNKQGSGTPSEETSPRNGANVSSPPDRAQGLRGPPPPSSGGPGGRNLPQRRTDGPPQRNSDTSRNADTGNWRK
ncbi:hypothetical protein CRE_26603 [Caenorhabditis remanei]|uniref:Uncharacterized protein n=1 Tax=Caenorhabditis remanei TaxID=31234 RepID=E3MKT6_CAERE|nr:hypothetical protein CRE_26603 [Caenorhabditis remanei]